jgi:hypothetical protein
MGPRFTPDEVDCMLSTPKQMAGLDHDLAQLPFGLSEKLLGSAVVGIGVSIPPMQFVRASFSVSIRCA